MTATLGDGNALQVQAPTGAVRRLDARPGVLPAALQRQRGGDRAGGVRRLRHHRPALAVRRLRRRRAGRIVLVLDHEPGERDEKSPFEGVVTAEPAAPWRKALAAQEKGAVGILFVSDVHNHPGAGQLRAGGARRVAGDAAAPEDLHAGGLGRSHCASRRRRSRRRWPRAGRRHRQVARGAGGVGRDRARVRGAAALPGARVTLRTSVDAPHRARSQRRRAARRQRSGAEERMGAGDRALRPQRRRRRPDLQRRRRQRLGHGGAARDRRRLRAGGRRRAAAEAQRAVRRVELGGARPARRLGLHRGAAGAARRRSPAC